MEKKQSEGERKFRVFRSTKSLKIEKEGPAEHLLRGAMRIAGDFAGILIDLACNFYF